MIAHHLRKTTTSIVTDIYVPTYTYPNLTTKLKNFFLKKIGKDVKYTYRDNFVSQLIGNKVYDTIFIVRPDLFSVKMIKQLRNKTPLFKVYFYDGIHRYPRKFKTLKLYNEIYSFEPGDCKEFGFIPITNYIYNEIIPPKKDYVFKYGVFNITTYDRHRFPILLKIASVLKNQDIHYKIIVKANKKVECQDLIDIINESISLEDVKSILQDSVCMLDLGQIQKHRGLTFRVFEALGLHKKIITNNSDIMNYDFYNPKNILVLDENNIQIPADFLNSDYIPIPKHIYNKYTIDTWVKTVFKEAY